MSWPLASHFSAMLQNPRLAFRDPALRECLIAKDERNQPRPWSGAFAVVYKAIAAGDQRPFAVRVFTTESPERRERYHEISAYLKSRKLSCLVDFEYRDESIRSAGDGKWYPLILMDWVQGDTLFKWCRARALAGDNEALGEAARRWVDLVKELSDARIAHGDLQHANVMVTERGELKLVDYDCMCVPALVGRRNLEVGVEPYQHPDRNADTHLSLDLDHFSALVIYIALRALAVNPSLWARYVEGPTHDKLLFRAEDIQHPEASPLAGDLLRLPDQDVRELAARLVELARGPLGAVPPLSELANSYAKIEALLHARRWNEAVELLNRRGQFRDAPKHLEPLIHYAYEHFCREQAWKAFLRIRPETSEVHDRRLVNAWNEVLFSGYPPAEAQRDRLGQARRRVHALDQLHLLVQKSPQATAIDDERRIVEAASRLPEGYQFGLQARVDRARRCVDAVRWLEQSLAEDADEVAIATMWKRVGAAGAERLVNRDRHARIDLALRRAPLLVALRGLSAETPADQRDRVLLEAWDESLLADCREAARWRSAHQAAVRRAEELKRLEEAVRERSDRRIAELAAGELLAGYPLSAPLEAAVEHARRQVAASSALEAALRGEDRETFVQMFDARLIRQFADRFEPYKSLLRKWTRSEILAASVIGLAPAVGRASLAIADAEQGIYRARWTWPMPRFTDQCLLAVARNKPGCNDPPDACELLHRETIGRTSWEAGGGCRSLRAVPQWESCFAVVWALIDLGTVTFASEPLVLGQFGAAARRAESGGRRWRWFGALGQPAGAPAEPPPLPENEDRPT